MKKILLPIDDSKASSKPVEYLGALTGADISIVLLHILDPVPFELQPLGRPEYPNTEKEQKVEDLLTRRREQWLQEHRKRGTTMLKRAKARLGRLGIPAESVNVEVRESARKEGLVKEMLRTAKELDCDTIVVGRHSFSWIKELLRRHVGDELVRKGKGLAIWVVE